MRRWALLQWATQVVHVFTDDHQSLFSASAPTSDENDFERLLGDRRLPFAPAARVLEGETRCFDVLLGTGKWMGNHRWFREQDIAAAQAEVRRVFGVPTAAQQFLAGATDHIAWTVDRIARRAIVLPMAAAPFVRQALLVLEGVRQMLRLEKYVHCVDLPVQTASLLCSFVAADLEAADCFGIGNICGDCVVFSTRPHVIVDAVWETIDSLDVGAPDPMSWMPPPRYPMEYSRGFCEELAGHKAFEGYAMQSLDPRGLPSPNLSMLQILRRMEAAGIALSFQLVNLGANNGACREGTVEHDPANCLALGGAWGGLFIEGDPQHERELQQTFAGRADVHILRATLGLFNTTSVLRACLEPFDLRPDIDLLKVDIDLCDDLVLERALATPFTPKVVHVEVQLIFPPDAVYRMRPGPHYRYGDAMSPAVSSLAAYLVASNYTLLHIEPPNAVLIRPDLAYLFPTTAAPRNAWDIWLDHYFCRADMPSCAGRGLWKFGDFDFAAFLEGGRPASGARRSDRRVVEAFVRRTSESLPSGSQFDLSFIGDSDSG